MTRPTSQSLSVVVPIYQGAQFITTLIDEIGALKTQLEDPGALYLEQLVLVDDDSRDGSLEKIRSLMEGRDWITLVNLSTNFGQHQATVAGILHASGDWICTIDEDLQHPPSEIPGLLKSLLRSEFDICYVKPAAGSHSKFRDFSSRATKSTVAALSGIEAVKHFSSFRIMRGSIARAAAAVVAHSTYFDVALTWFTDRIQREEIQMCDPRLKSGSASSYSLFGLVGHARRLVQSLELKALQVASAIGLLCATLSSALIVFATVAATLFPESVAVDGWASVVVITSFFGGTAVFLSGMLLDQVFFLSQNARGRPVFFIVDRSQDRDLLDWMER